MEREWEVFHAERTDGVEEIAQLRKKVAEEEELKKAGRRSSGGSEEQDVQMHEDTKDVPAANGTPANGDASPEKEEDAPVKNAGSPRENGARMEVDDEGGPPVPKEEDKKPTVPETVVKTTTADEDDAVEY